MSRRVLPYGLIFSGSKGDKSKNLSSTGTVATSASNRAALRRRVLTKCNRDKCVTVMGELVIIDGEEYLIVKNSSIRQYDKSTFLYTVYPGKYIDMQHIITENVTNMESLFENVTNFNQDISNWDVSNVTNMRNMFKGASSFNKPLDKWDVSSVRNMDNMFNGASSFNKNITMWNVSSNATLNNIFQSATSFNNRFTVSNTPSYTFFNNKNTFKYIWFKLGSANIQTHEIQCYVDNTNKALQSENGKAYFTTNDYKDQIVFGYNHTNNGNKMSSTKANDGDLNNLAHSWYQKYPNYRNLLVKLYDSFDVSDLQRITAYSRVSRPEMWNNVEYVELLDSKGTLKAQVDQRSEIFDDILYINYIGENDSNLSPDYKLQGNDVKDLYFEKGVNYIWFTGDVLYIEIHEVECYVNGVNIFAQQLNNKAFFTTNDYNERSSVGYNNTLHPANAIDQDLYNLAHNWQGNSEYSHHKNLLIEIDERFNLSDLQRIVVHKRRNVNHVNRWNGVDYVKLLDSRGNVIEQVDQRLETFDDVDIVNYIGQDDNNLSSDYKISGENARDINIQNRFSYIWFTGENPYIEIFEIECFIDGVNIFSQVNSNAFYTTGDYQDRSSIGWNHLNQPNDFAPQNAIDQDSSSISLHWRGNDTYRPYKNFLIQIEGSYNIDDLQRIVVHKRRGNDYRNRWNGVDYMKLLDSTGNVIKQIDQRSVEFDHVDYVNFIGKDDENLSSESKRYGMKLYLYPRDKDISGEPQTTTKDGEIYLMLDDLSIRNYDEYYLYSVEGERYFDMKHINTENVTNMESLFLNQQNFNKDISGWDVSNVSDMSNMFKGASSFNKNIQKTWNVSQNTNLQNMFQGATLFQNKYNVTDTPPIELFTETDEFKFLWFTGEYAKLQVHEVECYINNINKAIQSENGLAYFTTTDYLNRITDGFNHYEKENHNASFKANDGFFNNRAQTWIDEYPDYRNLLIELADKSAINDLQRIVVYKRRDAGFEDRWNTINFVQLLNSKGNVVAEIDQTPKTFDEFLYINYIGEDDNNLSSEIKLVGNDVRDMYFDPAKQETADQEALQKIEAQAAAEQEAIDQEATDQAQQEAQLENVTMVDQESDVTIVNSNGNKYRLNGDTTYDESIQYGLNNGIYTLKNVPQEHPMAIADDSGYITYFGEESNKLTTEFNGTTYDFYYGDISLTVAGDFEEASLVCYYHGYMGGENLLIYQGAFTDDTNLPPDAVAI